MLLGKPLIDWVAFIGLILAVFGLIGYMFYKEPRCPECNSRNLAVCRLPGCTDYWLCQNCKNKWFGEKNGRSDQTAE